MLTGRLVRLAPLRDEDVPLLLPWINDRDTALWSAPYHPVSESDHREWARGVIASSVRAFFVIQPTSDDRVVGTCQLRSIHPVHRAAELQIRIGEAADRGRGFGTTAPLSGTLCPAVAPSAESASLLPIGTATTHLYACPRESYARLN